MSFDPHFRFHGDDRPLDQCPPLNFWDAMRVEAAAELDHRRATYAGMVSKGRMKRTDADREMRVWMAIALDWRAVPSSGEPPVATWTEMVHCLRREIALRRQFYPRWIESGRITEAEAARKLALIEVWHDLLWHSGGQEGRDARADTERLRVQRQAA